MLSNFDREKWLDVVRRAGSNTAAVLTETTGVQRVALGEFAFALAALTFLMPLNPLGNPSVGFLRSLPEKSVGLSFENF